MTIHLQRKSPHHTLHNISYPFLRPAYTSQLVLCCPLLDPSFRTYPNSACVPVNLAFPCCPPPPPPSVSQYRSSDPSWQLLSPSQSGPYCPYTSNYSTEFQQTFRSCDSHSVLYVKLQAYYSVGKIQIAETRTSSSPGPPWQKNRSPAVLVVAAAAKDQQQKVNNRRRGVGLGVRPLSLDRIGRKGRPSSFMLGDEGGGGNY